MPLLDFAAVSDTAADYIRDASLAMEKRYEGDCATHACRVAALLLREGRAPWIARLRDIEMRGSERFHGPLVAQRYLGRGGTTWTTHYVAGAGRELYDPIVGAPIDVDQYAVAVFGREIPIATFLDAEATARLIAAGEIRRAFRP